MVEYNFKFKRLESHDIYVDLKKIVVKKNN